MHDTHDITGSNASYKTSVLLVQIWHQSSELQCLEYLKFVIWDELAKFKAGTHDLCISYVAILLWIYSKIENVSSGSKNPLIR